MDSVVNRCYTSRMNTVIPKRLQGILQSININKLDIKRDKSYIIHRILMLGTLNDIHWLYQTYYPRTIKHVFINYPHKEYEPARFYFITRFILSLDNQLLRKEQYVQNTPRDIHY